MLSLANSHLGFLRFENLASFQNFQKKEAQLLFKRELCKKQKQFHKIPWACEPVWSKKTRQICLQTQISHVSEQDLRRALREELDEKCQKHLKFLLKLLIYRKN